MTKTEPLTDPGLCICGHHKDRHKPDPMTDYRQEPCKVPGCPCGDYRPLAFRKTHE